MRPTSPAVPRLVCVALPALLLPLCGCTWISYLGTDARGSEHGRTYFVGGAGGVGNFVGTLDVPRGLRRAGYKGSIEVYAWQSIVGGTLRDQMDRARNEGEARRLSERIREYREQHPGAAVHIIALSGGTAIATWALEGVPRTCRVNTVVYLSSSLSREYDLSTALARIENHLYCFHSPHDRLLRYGLTLTGSMDRESTNAGAAGLAGFVVPVQATPWMRKVYAERLRNMPYLESYRRFGYYGMHTDSTSSRFVRHVLAPLLDGPAPEVPALAASPGTPPASASAEGNAPAEAAPAEPEAPRRNGD